MQTFTLFTVAALLSLVNAHGIPITVSGSGGESAKSPFIGSNQPTGPFWLPSTNGPVTDTTSPTTLCGQVATKSTSSLSVKAGDTLSYAWSSGYSNENGPWPHNTGPMLFYMAKCDGDCNDISGSTKFYKLQQQGYVSNGVWAQANVHAGQTVDFTVPASLAPGNYVIRQEIINLAIANAEMFPTCLSVTVTGAGTDTFSGTGVTFPGAYSASDPGLTVSGGAVYNFKSNSDYTFPGPPVASVGQSSSSSSSGGDSGSQPASSSSASSSSAATAPTQVVQGAGSDPASSTTTTSATSTASSTDSTGSSSTSTDSTSPSSSSSSTNPPPPSTDSTPSTNTSGTSSSGTSTLASCAQAWNDCNAKYDGSATAQADYTCQTDYTSCVTAAMSNGNVRRMHRRRRAFIDAVSH